MGGVAGSEVMEPSVDREPPPLPVGTRLIHIGPSKTGTTALQAAMWAARDSMRAQGVRYAGRSRHSESAARAIAGLKSPLSDEGNPPPIRLWEELVRSIHRATEPRLIFSSEFLAHSHDDAIRRLVDDIDPARIHVAVTLRPLGKILASQWQQSIQAGSASTYDAWLDSLFNRPAGSREALLWHRHRHDRLIERWAAIVGPDRVTAVVVDDRDHAHVLRMFEALLDLRVGTLELQQDLANRSLTLAEVEALRAFNESYRSAELGRALRTRVVRQGVASHLKARKPEADEARIETPQWALDRAGEVAREMVANISASGVHIVGDLGRLTEVPASKLAGDRLPVVEVPPTIAASMSIGILIAGGFARDGRKGPDGASLGRVPSTRVAKVIYRRLRAAARSRIRGTRRRIQASLARR